MPPQCGSKLLLEENARAVGNQAEKGLWQLLHSVA